MLLLWTKKRQLEGCGMGDGSAIDSSGRRWIARHLTNIDNEASSSNVHCVALADEPQLTRQLTPKDMD
jgi:hypothetical protein